MVGMNDHDQWIWFWLALRKLSISGLIWRDLICRSSLYETNIHRKVTHYYCNILFFKIFPKQFKKKSLHGALCSYKEAAARGILKIFFLQIAVLTVARWNFPSKSLKNALLLKVNFFVGIFQRFWLYFSEHLFFRKSLSGCFCLYQLKKSIQTLS